MVWFYSNSSNRSFAWFAVYKLIYFVTNPGKYDVNTVDDQEITELNPLTTCTVHKLGIVTNIKSRIKDQTWRTLHQDWSGAMTGKELAAICWVRNKYSQAISRVRTYYIK